MKKERKDSTRVFSLTKIKHDLSELFNDEGYETVLIGLEVKEKWFLFKRERDCERNTVLACISD